MRQWTKERYPKNWKLISRELRAKATHCDLCGKGKESFTWLTVHHIDGNPSNNDKDNLLVCCPKCHFAIQRAGFIHPEIFKKNSQLQINLFERG